MSDMKSFWLGWNVTLEWLIEVGFQYNTLWSLNIVVFFFFLITCHSKLKWKPRPWGQSVIWRTEEETHSLLFGNSPDLCFPHVLLPFVFYVNKIKSIQLSTQLVQNTTFAIGKKRWMRPRPLWWLALRSYLRWTELVITEKRVISQISREGSLQRAGGIFLFAVCFFGLVSGNPRGKDASWEGMLPYLCISSKI